MGNAYPDQNTQYGRQLELLGCMRRHVAVAYRASRKRNT